MINGRVAAILNDYKVIMDKGYNDGVRKDMTFVLYEDGDDIKDPTTGEVLDKEMKVKYTLWVAHVQEKMTTLYSADIEMKFFSLGPSRKKLKGIKIGDPIRQD